MGIRFAKLNGPDWPPLEELPAGRDMPDGVVSALDSASMMAVLVEGTVDME
jgi:hypothetical protein